MLIDEFDLFFELIGGQSWVSQSELFIEKTDDVISVFVKIIEMNEMLFMKNVWKIWKTKVFISMIESMFKFEFKIIMLFGQQWNVSVRGAGYEPISTVLMEPNHSYNQIKTKPVGHLFLFKSSSPKASSSNLHC